MHTCEKGKNASKKLQSIKRGITTSQFNFTLTTA